MDADRADKAKIRELWCAKVAAALVAARDDDAVPVYFTLPGRYARDLEALHAAGIIRRLPNGAIDQRDVWKVAAIESNSDAFMHLKDAWIGLDIKRADIKSVLASDAPLTWPSGRQRRSCRSRVINLDFNGACAGREVGGAVEYPQIMIVQKLAQLHVSIAPPLDWTLCLTFAADLQWSDPVCESVKQFLRENCQGHSEFAEECRRVLGDGLFARVLDDDTASWMTSLPGLDRQRILMAFVPKRILQDTYLQRWAIDVVHNLRYGGREDSKAMVSFVLDFKQEPRVASTPRRVYDECLTELMRNAAEVAADGQVHQVIAE